MKKDFKRGYVIVGLAVIMLLTSGILMVNKKSYAEPNLGKQCIEDTWLTSINEEEAYVKSENNKIDLPRGRYIREKPQSVPESDYRLFIGNSYNLFYKKLVQDEDGESIIYPGMTLLGRSSTNSILMNYLINETNFSNDKGEDDYYKQLLVFWALDRIAGFEDEKNYYDNYEYDQIVEAEKDRIYEDKYEIYPHDGNETYQWKYINNLSAGDKELLKNSEIGNKMIKYLDTWEKYINWYVDENKKVELDPVMPTDISYHLTNEYIETNLITPKSTGKVYSNKFDSYKIQVSEPMVVVDKSGETKTVYKAGESFRVRIPISKIKDKPINYAINIEGTFNFNTLTLYSFLPHRYEIPSEERMILYDKLNMSAVYRNCASTEKINTNLSLNFTKQIGNLNIKVIDVSTGDNLAKAEVAIYDDKNNIVYRYETTEKELNIKLPVGEYTVKQTITPPNYEAKTIEMRVSITENNTSEALLENIPLISVADTSKTSGYIPIIGFIILTIGILIIGILIKNKKHE